MVIDYFEPVSIAEALGLLERYGDDAAAMAGGQSLLVMMRHRLVSPKYLVSLEKVQELRGVRENDRGELVIGAMTTHKDVYSSTLLKKSASLLCQAAAKVGSTPIRNLGTIGGNICHNELGADPPPALLALDAKAVCVKGDRERTVPLSEFFTGYFETCLQPGEVVRAIEIPSPPSNAVGLYLKHVVRAGDLAIVGVAVLLVLDGEGERCREARIGLGGVAEVPLRAIKAERIVGGSVVTDEIVNEAARVAMSEVDPISDPHGSAEYRRKLVGVFVRRAICQALNRGLGKRGGDL